MATGITRREQHSPDAISAGNHREDRIPLPTDDATVTLSYPNKASMQDVVRKFPRRFVELRDAGEHPIGRVPDNAFVLGDNLFVLNALLAQGRKATLFYLDPPYRTGFGFQSRDLEHAYNDNMGHATYLEFMRRRFILMRECMSDDGSMYVHIGHKMLGHIKVLMDEIFGSDNFRNLIARRKCSSKNFTRRQYPNLNDYLLFYSKTKKYKWTQPRAQPDEQWIEREYPKTDTAGRRFKLVPIHAPGTRHGETGQPWRGMVPPPGKHWQHVPSTLDEFDRRGEIHWSRNGNPRRKVYWTGDRNPAITDYWSAYRDAHHQSVKVTGYPTEKNLTMLKMIVGASSDPDDLVVDPFCGSGTTLDAARDLERKYLGIDASFEAAKATLRRMRYGLEPMGDYVNGTASRALVLPLFADNDSRQPCRFIADDHLLTTHKTDIQQMSAI